MRLITLLLALTTCLCADIPEPYASLEVLPFDRHGWFINQEPMKALLDEKQPLTVIEVGSWLGSSTRFIASHIPEDGKVYAIDTWLGSPTEAWHQKDHRLPYLYQQFLSNVVHENLCHKIIPVRMTSMEAAKALKVKADLIYLDGAHDTDSVTHDIVFWRLHLKEGGILCGDDWAWVSVQIAVRHCASVFGYKIHHTENFWWYE